MQLLPRVDSVDIKLSKTTPPHLIATAISQLPAVYENIVLEQKRTDEVPTDGILDFQFLSNDVPGQRQSSILRLFSADAIVNPIPPGLRGVRVHSKSNKIEFLLPEAGKTRSILIHGWWCKLVAWLGKH